MHCIGTDSRRHQLVTIAPARSWYDVRELPPPIPRIDWGAARRERAAGCGGDRREDAAILGLRTAADNTSGGMLLLLPPPRTTRATVPTRNSLYRPPFRAFCLQARLASRTFVIPRSLTHSLQLSLPFSHSFSLSLLDFDLDFVRSRSSKRFFLHVRFPNPSKCRQFFIFYEKWFLKTENVVHIGSVHFKPITC